MPRQTPPLTKLDMMVYQSHNDLPEAIMAAIATSHLVDRRGMLSTMDAKRDEQLDFTPENIKLRREELGLTQTKLGGMLTPPAGQRTIVSWEQGDYNVRGARRRQLANILGLSLEEVAPTRIAGASVVRTNLVQAKALIEDALRELDS